MFVSATPAKAISINLEFKKTSDRIIIDIQSAICVHMVSLRSIQHSGGYQARELWCALVLVDALRRKNSHELA